MLPSTTGQLRTSLHMSAFEFRNSGLHRLPDMHHFIDARRIADEDSICRASATHRERGVRHERKEYGSRTAGRERRHIGLFWLGSNLHETKNVLPPHKGGIDEARRQQIALTAWRPARQSWRPYARLRNKLVEAAGQPCPGRRLHRPTVPRWLRDAPGLACPVLTPVRARCVRQ